MSKSIQIVKHSTIELPDISSYKLVVRAENAQNMPDKIFVKQRIRNFAKNTIDETFVAVCTPTQLEDFEEDAPGEGSSYFRTNQIELVGRTPEWLVTVFDSLLYETKKLVVDLTDLDSLSEATVYNITAIDAVAELSSAPTAPAITYVTPGVTQLSVFFTAPSAGNVVNYEYSTNNGATWISRSPISASSPLVVSGLTSNTSYTIKIRGVNSIGFGVSSSTVTAKTLVAQ